MEGWLDASFPQAALNAFQALKNPMRVIIGPWGHGGLIGEGPSRRSGHSAVNPDDQLLRFFDFYLKNAEDPPFPGRLLISPERRIGGTPPISGLHRGYGR